MMFELQPGQQLDRFRIVRLVARSAMAWIYQATDARDGSLVALKVPLPEVESDVALYDRFKREQSIGLRMNHPNVLHVVPKEPSDNLYLVMPWVEGELLRTLLDREGKLPAERAIRITLQICDALGYIHQQGIVHRDLKPENIMVGSGSVAGAMPVEQDHVTLIDFGIAVHSGARRLTFAKFSDTLGTADYISPEQVRGRRGDARSDLYELGVMLYEMLTGTVPFTGTNALRVMNDRLVNGFIPPRQLEPAISAELEEVIYRALEREPKNRYQSAKEFARELSHPEEVVLASHPEAEPPHLTRLPEGRGILKYVLLAMIPLAVFALLLLASYRR